MENHSAEGFILHVCFVTCNLKLTLTICLQDAADVPVELQTKLAEEVMKIYLLWKQDWSSDGPTDVGRAEPTAICWDSPMPCI